MRSFLQHPDVFQNRHIGPNEAEISEMLQAVGAKSVEELIEQTVPSNIRLKKKLNIPTALSEQEYLTELKKTANMNRTFRSFIGQGYYGTFTPSVILRNVFENPGWYTQYTPYQAEIAQGRLESLLNFQTMVSDMTGLPIANASLLDEGTAAAEAMSMFYHERHKRGRDPETVMAEFFIDEEVFAQTIDVIRTRATPIGINLIIGDWKKFKPSPNCFGALLQYPNSTGEVEDYSDFVAKIKEHGGCVVVAADILALALLTPPGEWGADACVGNTQRFGVPMGFGGPHAAFFATTEKFKRNIPGRIIGVSKDRHGNQALRMALQTREQHIRREKATSNICTAQALLANMAAMYAVYHGPDGIRAIAKYVHEMTIALVQSLEAELGFKNTNSTYFGTLCFSLDKKTLADIKKRANRQGYNLYFSNTTVQVSLDETVSEEDLEHLIRIFGGSNTKLKQTRTNTIPNKLRRTTPFLEHSVFNSYHSESEMMRYLKRLENKDLSLTHSMISLGSCTMKLNAATEMMPVSWEEFSTVHPFAPSNQTKGYQKVIRELESFLCEITGFEACSLQPNSGAQGEFAGLMVIRAYHESRGDFNRNIAIIPSSAHGTNPASAVMASMKVVVVNCDERGNMDLADLRVKALENSENLSCLMVTYPSTHGVFESSIREMCEIIHQHGGKVYMDGANMNAQVGLTSPAAIGADVCHLNLHKTFAIPHGGGGPGMGPICCNTSLAPFLPGHVAVKTGGRRAVSAVSAAPWGSASILLISYAYIKLLGAEGIKRSTEIAILNANYIKSRLEATYTPLYVGEKGRVAHELIIDLRPFKEFVGAEDVAKRLIDYGFHAPTLSFPVAGTIMIEPTESENKAELDRFCDALLSIKNEIDAIARGDVDAQNNIVRNAPHTLGDVTSDDWNYPYVRSEAAYPLPYLKEVGKFWATVGRIDQAFGDKNLICTCPSIEEYAS